MVERFLSFFSVRENDSNLEHLICSLLYLSVSLLLFYYHLILQVKIISVAPLFFIKKDKFLSSLVG